MIEWLAASCFSFLEGCTHPDDLVEKAEQLGYQGLGLADRQSLSGVVRAHGATSEIHKQGRDFFFAPGIRLHFDGADPLFVFPLHKKAYGSLCAFLSEWALAGMAGGEKGLNPISWPLFKQFLRSHDSIDQSADKSLAKSFHLISVTGRFFLWPDSKDEPTRVQTQDHKPASPSFCTPPTAPGLCPFWLLELREICGSGAASALSLAYPLSLSPGISELWAWLEEQAQALQIPLVATSLPLYRQQDEQDLADLLASIRHGRTVQDLGFLRQANSERRLLSVDERQFFRSMIEKRNPFNDPFARTLELAGRHHFSLSELSYTYPKESLPEGESAPSFLRKLVMDGAKEKYPLGLPWEVSRQIEHELKLISELNYEDYFLTIWDILGYARRQKILFQGRGSAANSIVCFCLGITAIDPVRMNLLFERFLSVERNEPPDIDVDFEHERREEVMQEVYARYGRKRAAMVATYICFRSRMAIRECAKSLGFSVDFIDAVQKVLGRESFRRLKNEDARKQIEELRQRFQIKPFLWDKFLKLVPQLVGLPRHLGIHTGGFILSSEDLSQQSVLMPARMKDRSVVPWDKNDVETLKWMKVDLLSLGMLTAIRKCFDLIGHRNPSGTKYTLASVPSECPAVYDALGRADTVGVFQIESRAQMNMLPRLLPKKFYDLVVEVAIVRPGPLQGGMVHPYLKRRQGLEPVVFDHPRLEPILKKTLGIPIFQEQVMKMAIEIAGFTPGEADQLRKVMSGAWRAKSKMHHLRTKLINGMSASGLSGEFTERVYRQIEGFGEYGFPESHAASFAILTYVSSYLKVHHPAEFAAALINSQPMGFYSPRALVGDAERHGVDVRPIDILFSGWDCRLEDNPRNPTIPALRLGLRLVKGLRHEQVQLIESLQNKNYLSPERPLPDATQLRQAGLELRSLDLLIKAHALRDPTSPDTRRKQMWDLARERKQSIEAVSFDYNPIRDQDFVQAYSEWEALMADYAAVGLSPGKHPVPFARSKFFRSPKWVTAEELYEQKTNIVEVIGLVAVKQRPPTAGGLVFVTLEDETGFINLTLMPDVYDQYRIVLNDCHLLAAKGRLERSAQFSLDQDPKKRALSVRVTELWNPFVRSDSQAPIVPTRDWH